MVLEEWVVRKVEIREREGELYRANMSNIEELEVVVTRVGREE